MTDSQPHLGRVLRGSGLLVFLVLGLLLLPLPTSTRFSASLHGIAHVAMGAALAAMLAHGIRSLWPARPKAWRALASLGLVTVVLGLGELLQPLGGRTASLDDLAVGLAGAVAGLTLLAAQSRAGIVRAALRSLALAILMIPMLQAGATWHDIHRQRSELPIIASFADRLELTRWRADDADYELSPEHVTHGDTSLLVTLQSGAYPGVGMAWVPPDWRAYQSLTMDIWLGGDKTLDLILKVEDRRHDWHSDFRSLHPVVLEPGPNALRFHLDAIRTAPEGGPIDLSQIAGFTLMAVGLESTRRFWLDGIRLVE